MKTKSAVDLEIREDAGVTEVGPVENLLDLNLIGSAIMQCLIENDPEGVMEIIESHLYALNKSKFLREAKVPRSTMYQLLKRKNPTIKTLAKIIYATYQRIESPRGIMTSNTMPLSILRGHKLFNEIAIHLRTHSLTISPVPNLEFGGSGTLVKYKNLSGILTATHVMANYLNDHEIFIPSIATSDPTFFQNDKVSIKRIIYLETQHGIKLLQQKQPWPEDTLDICFIEIEEKHFQILLERSFKKPIDLEYYRNKYLNHREKYYGNPSDWSWAFDGSPREGSYHNDDQILISKFDGCYLGGGAYKTTPLIHVISPFEQNADLCIHMLDSKDKLPQTFGGGSGAGMWQICFEGNNGVPERIHELFFTGVCVAEFPDSLLSRGPSSLYDIFLGHLDTFCC